MTINRTVPVCAGLDKKGNTMATLSQDAVIEMTMKFTHEMGFQNLFSLCHIQ